jgi:GNAT superfamily N-acetyltransferase
MNFHDALSLTYCENPCQVLPNALWKTLARLEGLQTAVGIEKNVVNHLAAWNERVLLVYWTRDRDQPPDFSWQQTALDLGLLHQDYLGSVPSAVFETQTPYFRLIARWSDRKTKRATPSGFSIVQVNVPQEVQEVANLLGQCYQDLHPSAATVQSWTEHPVFDSGLWIWVMNEATGLPVGLGIAEFDKGILEGSLEWIQVLPGYRGRGIGKCIVEELLSRLEQRAEFTTVAGIVGDSTNPEALYRSCGFSGSDIWWVLRS